MIDYESLLFQLFARDLPAGTAVMTETDASAADALPNPVLIFSVTNNGQTRNGPGLWDVDLFVNVTGEPGLAWGLASAVYDVLHVWDQTLSGVVDDVGGVQDVTDTQALTRVTSTNIAGKGYVQYSGSYSLSLLG